MARNLGLGGVMVWTIDTDDFLGDCYDETFHLIQHAKDPWYEPIDPDYEVNKTFKFNQTNQIMDAEVQLILRIKT